MSTRARIIIAVVVALALGIVARIVYPLESLHIEIAAEPVFQGPFTFTNSMLVTLIVDVILIALAIGATRNMQLVPRGLQNTMEAIIEAMFNFFRTINSQDAARAFPIVATIFFYVLVSNWLGLFPGFGTIGYCYDSAAASTNTRIALVSPFAAADVAPVAAEGSPYVGCSAGQSLIPFFRSPSADLNTTLALALIAVIYIEYMGFRALGLGHLNMYFNFRGGVIGVIVGIFELISVIARIPAFMFRLFGNIFAGEVLLIVMIFLVPLVIPLPLYLFEVFVGFIQAFIFAVLTMAFMNLAVSSHHGEGHDKAEAAH